MKCPNCGYMYPLEKGQGRVSAKSQTHLSAAQYSPLPFLWALNALDTQHAVTRNELASMMAREAMSKGTRIPSQQTVTYWLSDLLGCGFVSMENRACRLKDDKTMSIRFVKKPVWWLSDDYQKGMVSLGAVDDLGRMEIVRL